MGLGSCWAQIRLRSHDETSSAEDFLKRLLGLPESFAVECVIGLGYPDEVKSGHSLKDLPFDQVHRKKFTR